MQRLGIGIVLLLGWMVVAVGAQGSAWSVWLYDSANGRAVQVDNAGTLLYDIQLPAPAEFVPGRFNYSYGLAVSQDGTRLAYSVTGEAAFGTVLTSLVVYDVAAADVLLTYQPPISPAADALSLSHNPRLFNLTGGAIAYSYAAGDSAGSQLWQIVVLDTFTGTTLADITNSNPALEAQNFDAAIAPFLLSHINYYEGAAVNFTLVAFGSMALNQTLANFVWDAITGRVIRSSEFPNNSGDHLAISGESITPVRDERVAFDPQVGLAYANALQVFRTEIGAPAPFYASATLELVRANFVQNGERVVAQARALTDAAPVWLLVERSGVSQTMPRLDAYGSQLVGTPDGFVYVLTGTPPVAINASTRAAVVEFTPLWVGPDGTFYAPVWATPPQQPATSEWAQLAPPVFEVQSVVVPADPGAVSAIDVGTVTSSQAGILTINALVLIATTEGDRLNMRSEPTVSGSIVARVDNGTQAVVLDGPVAGDGFTWWQIRLNNGITGWVVESADGVRTLIPAG